MIGTEYDDWYLQTLTQTQQTQKTKYVQSDAQHEKPEQTAQGVKNADTVEFSAKALQKLEQTKIPTVPVGSDIVHATSDKQFAIPSDVEKPDFKAISLIKASEIKIEYPKEETLIDKQQAMLDQRVAAMRESRAQQAETPDRISDGVTENNAMTSAKPEAKARTTSERVTEDFQRPVLNESVREKEQSANTSPTTNTTDELEATKTSAKITPTLRNGIEAYQQMQNYTNSLVMSVSVSGNMS